MPRFIFDSRQHLATCSFPDLSRQIGVFVSEPFKHHGFTPPAEHVDLSYETISINTRTFGNSYPVAEWKPKAHEMTRTTIHHLDQVITELTAHRNRLQASLTDLA